MFKDFCYQSRPRAVVDPGWIAKAEHLNKGANPRFIVTSLAGDARSLYEVEYCGRGDMENRIKEQQLCLFADRTSSCDDAGQPIALVVLFGGVRTDDRLAA